MEVTVIRSNRKTVSIQIKPDLTVQMRVPNRISKAEIDRILREKEPWIREHLEKLSKRQAEMAEKAEPVLTSRELRDLAEKAVKYIPERVSFFAPQVGVTYGRITIRNQKTRWGSCSSKGNLNFNCLLMLTPPEVIDYVVIHELCHRKEMNHSKAFWAEVEKVCPDWKKSREWLKKEGNSVMRRFH